MAEGGEDGARVRAERERRLAEALRANLRRRKAQARSRREGEADARVGLPAAAADKPPESGC